MKKILIIPIALLIVFLWASPSYSGNSVCEISGTYVSSRGLGKLPPGETNRMKARLLAVRAAVVEARRNLLSCLTKGSAPPTENLKGKVRGALVTRIMYLNDGSVLVTVTLDTAGGTTL